MSYREKISFSKKDESVVGRKDILKTNFDTFTDLFQMELSIVTVEIKIPTWALIWSYEKKETFSMKISGWKLQRYHW